MEASWWKRVLTLFSTRTPDKDDVWRLCRLLQAALCGPAYTLEFQVQFDEKMDVPALNMIATCVEDVFALCEQEDRDCEFAFVLHRRPSAVIVLHCCELLLRGYAYAATDGTTDAPTSTVTDAFRRLLDAFVRLMSIDVRRAAIKRWMQLITRVSTDACCHFICRICRQTQ